MFAASDAAADLAACIEAAYAAFARPAPAALGVCMCACCVAPATEAELRTTPLREISSSLLAEYTHSAHGDGDRDELQYFLPRYFDLIALADYPSHYGPEICLRRMGALGWREWPEAAVVESTLEAMFGAVMSPSTPLGADCIEDVLLMLAIAGAHPSALVNRAAERAMHLHAQGVANGLEATAGRLALLCCQLRGGNFTNAFWTDASAAKLALERAVVSEPIVTCLLQASEATKDAALSRLLDEAFERM